MTAQQEYEGWCDECSAPMNYRSKDGLQVYCVICWVPVPVPLAYLSTSTKLDETKRLKTLAAQREAILA